MKLFYIIVFYVLCRYFVFGDYSCREVDDNFKLRYKIEPRNSGILLNKSLNLSIYAKNYNVLSFENGKAGVLFSN